MQKLGVLQCVYTLYNYILENFCAFTAHEKKESSASGKGQ